MAICPIIVHFITQRTLEAWRGVLIGMRSKDVQKQMGKKC